MPETVGPLPVHSLQSLNAYQTPRDMSMCMFDLSLISQVQHVLNVDEEGLALLLGC